jgi:hypothetical protein
MDGQHRFSFEPLDFFITSDDIRKVADAIAARMQAGRIEVILTGDRGQNCRVINWSNVVAVDVSDM